jgi:ankyrin repeat protein
LLRAFRSPPNFVRTGKRGAWVFAALVFAALCILSAAGSAVGNDALNPRLFAAAERGNAAEVRQLLGQGADKNARRADGATPMIAAALAQQMETVRALIDAGADLELTDHLRRNAFHAAAVNGNTRILKLTIAAGVNVHSLNRFGGTALIPACHYGHVDNVRVLLATAIDRNHVNQFGWTALLEAVILGDGGARHTEIVRLLIDSGADVNRADGDGATPLAHAHRRGYTGIVALLERAGAR